MISLLKKIYPYLKPHLRLAILASVCAIPLASIKGYQAYFIKDVIDGIFDPNATPEYAYKLAAILFGLALVNYPFRYIHYYGIRMVVDYATCGLRRDIYKKFQHLDSKYFANSKQGKLISVMLNDTEVFSQAFQNGLAVIREPLTAIALLGVAFYHDWKLTLIIFTVLPLFILVFTITGKRIRRYVSKAQEDNAIMTHHASEGLLGQKIIKAFNLQDYMISRFDKAQQQFLQHRKKSNSAEEHSHPLVETIGGAAFASIIVIAYYRNQQTGLTAGEFMSFVGALALFMDPVRRFSKANTKLNQARAAADRIFNLLKEPNETNNGSSLLENFSKKIEFKNVSFKYPNTSIYVLKNFNLIINHGEKVALVGLSGSGKSTIISLLLRLYDIEEGEILIDGVNLENYDLYSLRSELALVSQDIFLFNDSIEENLKAGSQYSKDQLAEALRVSHSQEFIDKLPDGIKTEIGDRGLRLSGGQSQRLTIARAFLRNSPILLFDEATSALDNESEKVVQKALDEISQQKTVIAIAHRLTTIQDYDKIVVMSNGEKLEEGTHKTLINSAGEYQKLYELSSI